MNTRDLESMASEIREVIGRYFPNLSEKQWEQLEALPELYKEWNEKINVISRKDIDNLVVNHILHSMSIGLYTDFKPMTAILDVGTGGGLPGIPLAILFPECQFTLIDSIGKKVKVATSIKEAIGLGNALVLQSRAEDIGAGFFDFIVSRAAMPMKSLVRIGEDIIDTSDQSNTLRNGVIALKGGDLTEELKPFRKSIKEVELSTYLPDLPFFETKKIVYYPVR